MTFRAPWLLLALALPLLLAAWHALRAGHPLRVPVDRANVPHHPHLRRLVLLAESLPAGLLAVAILVLAGPQRQAPPRDERVLTNILFCLDVSGSMGWPVSVTAQGPKSRYDAAMDAIAAFCDYRQGDAFGLTIFGDEYLHWLPPTRDLDAIRRSAPFLKPGTLPYWFGGTEIAKALDGCRRRLLESPDGDRAIILVSDGSSGDFDNGRDDQIARALAADGIRLYFVQIGDEDGGPAGRIAARTGGRHFNAVSPATLAAVFREIDAMQKTRFEQGSSETVEHYRPFAIAGGVLLALHVFAQLGLRFTPW